MECECDWEFCFVFSHCVRLLLDEWLMMFMFFVMIQDGIFSSFGKAMSPFQFQFHQSPEEVDASLTPYGRQSPKLSTKPLLIYLWNFMYFWWKAFDFTLYDAEICLLLSELNDTERPPLVGAYLLDKRTIWFSLY